MRKTEEEIKERNRLRQKKWRDNNKESKVLQSKKYRDNNKEKIKEYAKEYNAKYKPTKNIKRSIKRVEDTLYRLKCLIRCSVSRSLKAYTKKSRTFEILGCDYEFFKSYIESKFESWMNWDNQGLYNMELNYGWDLDHIIPLSSATTEEEIIKLNHYTNLQPLCSRVNRDIKRDNIL